MPVTAAIADRFACPTCRATPLAPRAAGWACPACGCDYPSLDGIPCLLAEPAAALAEWRLRLQRLVAELRRDAAEHRDALARVASAAARTRLKLKAAALDDHARRLVALLAPLAVDAPGPALETHRALGIRPAESQGLAAYYVNAHRDWVWGREENDAAHAAVTSALGAAAPRRLLVLGAGAGRLAYDLHQRGSAELTVALDVNPLFALLARRLYAGDAVELYEFPVAPRDAGSQAILRTLAAEAQARDGLEVVIGDATRAPFAAESFDAVVTPWLIDVIDEDFATFAPRVNALLRPGGCWVNTGSLAFAHADPARHYGLDEVVAIVAASGFSAPEPSEQHVPYLCSPASRHGRRESVVTFRAVRQVSVPLPCASGLPDWLERSDRPVPALPAIQSATLAMRVYGFVAGLVNGQRSVADIARVLVDERLMTADGAEVAVRGFLRQLHEDVQRRTGF